MRKGKAEVYFFDGTYEEYEDFRGKYMFAKKVYIIAERKTSDTVFITWILPKGVK